MIPSPTECVPDRQGVRSGRDGRVGQPMLLGEAIIVMVHHDARPGLNWSAGKVFLQLICCGVAQMLIADEDSAGVRISSNRRGRNTP